LQLLFWEAALAEPQLASPKGLSTGFAFLLPATNSGTQM